MSSMFNGAFRERVRNSWVEMRENLTRSTLQSLGVILGVASVLGGFSISDSMRRRSMELYVKMGGLDKLNVRQSAVVKEGAPTALQMANLGLRTADADDGEELDSSAVDGISLRKDARARVRSPYADQERDIRGIGGDFLALDGYEIDQGRDFTMHDIDTAAPVAILGTEAVAVFFPNGDALGRTLRIGDTPVQVVGILKERVFRFRDGQRNIFRWRNRIIAIPTTLVARRFEGDQYHRVDRVTFRIRKLDAMANVLEGALERAQGESPPAGGLPPRRRGRARPQGAVPGRRLRHHLPALGLPVADRRRHRQRQHPDGDAEGAHPRGRRQDGDRRAGPRGLQGVHDGGAAADGGGLARRASSSASDSRRSSRPRSASPSTSTRRASSRRTCSPRSSASCSRSSRRGRPRACRPMEALRYE